MIAPTTIDLGNVESSTAVSKDSSINPVTTAKSVQRPSKIKISKSGEFFLINSDLKSIAYDCKPPDNTKISDTNSKLDISPSELGEIPFCRICLVSDQSNTLISPCSCTGSQKFVHEDCLKTWLLRKNEEDLNRCEVCKNLFKMEFEVSSSCMPFRSCKTCKAWIPIILSVFLLLSLIYICYLAISKNASGIYVIISVLILSFFFIACCVVGICTTFSVCFERKIEGWKIEAH